MLTVLCAFTLAAGAESSSPENYNEDDSRKRLDQFADNLEAAYAAAGMAAIDIQTGEVLEGHLPPKALAMVREWSAIHKDDLLHMWETQEFKSLSPLE